MFEYAVLDPRPTPEASAANDKVFEDAPAGVLGIEITVPALAARCSLGNIDPQHGPGGDASRAAIEAAMEWPLPPKGAVLATVRPDLDSVGAMAILGLRAEGVRIPAGGVRRIADADKFARGPWPGPRVLPTTADPWPSEGGAADTRELAPLGALCADFRRALAERVAGVEEWLLFGEAAFSSARAPFLADYVGQVERERAEMIRALEEGEVRVEEAAGGKIALVDSTHRAAMAVGYARAPVVVARNPSFKVGGGDPHLKFTVAQYEPGHVDLKAALAELAEREPGWGGSPTIIGSPQGVASTLSAAEVVEVVARYLK